MISLRSSSSMTIAAILDGAQVNVLTVTVIDIIKLGLLIVGDTTGLVLLKLGQSGNPQTVKCVEKYKGLKILRPVKESNSVLSTNGKYRPQKTEKQKIIADPFFARETALRDLAAEIKCDKGVSFNQIKSCKKDATISSVFVFCTSMSRCIKGNYGDYR